MSGVGRFRPVKGNCDLTLAVRFPLGLLTGEARTVTGHKSPEVPRNIPSRKFGDRLCAWRCGEFDFWTVNPQVPGSSPGRGANIHAGFGRFCGLVLLRNSGWLLKM
jgi:hypothetical protein